jgi:hypothetical protein
MKLLIRRSQRSGLIGKAVFVFEVRADISKGERSNIAKYKLADTVLYEKNTLVDRGSGMLGVASRLLHKALNISVTVADLTDGKKVECKDIIEMIAVEEQIKEAAVTFKAVLDAAANFGGEEVLEL